MSKKRKAEKRKKKPKKISNETVKFICLQCKVEEEIPLSVVRHLDSMDDGDPEVPPQFSCEACGGAMYPENYKGVHGYEDKISNILR